jgi:hypothetical protein
LGQIGFAAVTRSSSLKFVSKLGSVRLPMTHPIKGIHHVAIAVTDVPSATHFYVQAAQLSPWPAAQGLILPELGNMWRLANAGIRFLSADPSGQQQKRRAVSEAGLTHMCLRTQQSYTMPMQRLEAASTLALLTWARDFFIATPVIWKKT